MIVFKKLVRLMAILSSLGSILVSSHEISKAPKIVDRIEKFNHPEDTNATFTCSIGSGDLSDLTYEWRKDDVIIKSNSNLSKLRITTLPENYQSILRVINLKASDAGHYSCLAKNKHGSDKVITQLTVKVQMRWLNEPQDVQASVGKQIVIPCEADGLPAPNVTWTKVSGKTIAGYGHELRFDNLQQSDSGYYECRASNGVEQDLVSRIKLDVLETTKCHNTDDGPSC